MPHLLSIMSRDTAPANAEAVWPDGKEDVVGRDIRTSRSSSSNGLPLSMMGFRTRSQMQRASTTESIMDAPSMRRPLHMMSAPSTSQIIPAVVEYDSPSKRMSSGVPWMPLNHSMTPDSSMALNRQHPYIIPLLR